MSPSKYMYDTWKGGIAVLLKSNIVKISVLIISILLFLGINLSLIR